MRINKTLAAAGCIMIFTAIAFAVFVCSAEDGNVKFLRERGWIAENGCVEQAEIIIPDPFDAVYESYNKIQLLSGFDLRPYRGMRGMRYTYIISNYPQKDVGEVRANVICIDGKPVGGDICTVSANGFMHGL